MQDYFKIGGRIYNADMIGRDIQVDVDAGVFYITKTDTCQVPPEVMEQFFTKLNDQQGHLFFDFDSPPHP